MNTGVLCSDSGKSWCDRWNVSIHMQHFFLFVCFVDDISLQHSIVSLMEFFNNVAKTTGKKNTWNRNNCHQKTCHKPKNTNLKSLPCIWLKAFLGSLFFGTLRSQRGFFRNIRHIWLNCYDRGFTGLRNTCLSMSDQSVTAEISQNRKRNESDIKYSAKVLRHFRSLDFVQGGDTARLFTNHLSSWVFNFNDIYSLQPCMTKKKRSIKSPLQEVEISLFFSTTCFKKCFWIVTDEFSLDWQFNWSINCSSSAYKLWQ